jgi:2-keto-4-pentenoate hydratase/2-oxohepta-3-ene-1,7-dioic acid hydratase in catechol pathway
MSGRVVRWVRFIGAAADSPRIGVLDQAGTEILVHDGELFTGAEPTGERIALDAINTMVPCQPTKMIGLWNNLREAAQKQGWSAPSQPLYFFKAPSSFVGHGGLIARPAAYTGRVVYEGELGIVIGAMCTDVPLADVDDVVFGYTCVNDVTAIDLIAEDESFAQWCRAKSFDTFGAFGPVIAAGLDPVELRVRTLVGGKVRQDYPVSDMFFSPRELVHLISRDMTLMPGDVIACGTSTGVLPMRPGVPVEVEIEGIGILRNALAD